MKFLIDPNIIIVEIYTQPIQQLDEIDEIDSSIDTNVDKEISIPKDVLNSFKIKDTLEPQIWLDGQLNPKVQKNF